MSRSFWAIIAVIIAVFAGIVIFSGKKTSAPATSQQPTNHVTGSPSTGVKLVIYGDFQCPYCEQYEPTLQQVRNEFKNQVEFQFRHFPLTNLHPNAFAAARTAEAAANQGKFWEMHDLLYAPANWQQWTTSSSPTPLFEQYASQLGLNLAKFRQDFASSATNDKINADISAGTKAGVQGTPSFFFQEGSNLKKVQLANSVGDFEKAIRAEIAKQQPSGNSAAPAAKPAPAP